MSSSNMKNFSLAELLFLLLTLLLIPCAFMQTGFSYFENQRQTRIVEATTLELLKPINELKAYKSNEEFWCQILSEEFRNCKNPSDFIKRIKELSKQTGEPVQYAVWEGTNRVIETNFIADSDKNNWHSLMKDMRTARYFDSLSQRNAAEARIRMLLGPQYFGIGYRCSIDSRKPKLARADSAGKWPLIWMNDSDIYSAIVLLRPDVINKEHRLKLAFQRWCTAKKHLVSINPGNIVKLRGKFAQSLKRAYFAYLKSGQEIFRFNNLMIAISSIKNSECIAYFTELESLKDQSGKKVLLIFLISIFSVLLLIRSGYISALPGNISIRSQLLLLLFISAGIPLLTLCIVALEHLQQKRDHLIKAAHQKCIEYIQDIDRRSQSETSQVIVKAKAAIEEFKKQIKAGSSDYDVFKNTFDKLHASRSDFRAVASSGNYLTSQNGFYQNGLFQEFAQHKRLGRHAKLPTELKVLNDLGSYLLAFLNHAEIDPDKFTEIEILVEMFYQKPLTEVIHDLVLLNTNIAPLGWGNQAFPVYGENISLIDSSATKDFFILIPHFPRSISKTYFFRQAANLIRNEFGLKIYLTDGDYIFPGEKRIFENPELSAIFAQVGSHPSNEPQTADMMGKKWIFAGFQGQFLGHLKILALSPLSEIDESIGRERYFILYSGLTAALILLSITLLFGHSFIFPLSQLQKAAIAVEKREFRFQLPQLSNDEFGEMGKVFNKSISELEELSIASIVQGHLMPDHTIDAGIFDVYGKSVPMAELGGDYFDYFAIDNNRFSVLLGDVAGHGVGASLIMAMAKAGIICSEQHLAEPAIVLSGLHKMIGTTRSKTQRKIMTFQYLYLDKQSGVGKYANAGACSPMLVNCKTGLVSEISLTGPVLGGFKNSKFTEIDLSIQDGEALVLYTDGIVETKNPEGIELGYEGLKQVLLQNYSSNAKKYYEAVFAAYLAWLGNGAAQDDLTLIMIVRSNN